MNPFSSLLGQISFGKIFIVILFLAYWLEAFFIIYHLIRFGIGPRPKFFALVFFVGSAMIFMMVSAAFSQLNLNISSGWMNLDFNFISNLIKPF